MAARKGEGVFQPQVLGARLRQLREGLGLVLQDVADLFGTSRSVPSQWEGAVREPSFDSLLRLADFYGVTTDWLLGREGAEKDSPRVKQVKSLMREHLRLKEGTLVGHTPGQRLHAAIEFLLTQDREMFSLARIAQQLLISPETLQDMMFGRTMATAMVIQRFAQYAHLPELWFYQPIPQLEDPVTKYREVLERIQAEGISPDEVEQRIWGPKKRTGARRGRRSDGA